MALFIITVFFASIARGCQLGFGVRPHTSTHRGVLGLLLFLEEIPSQTALRFIRDHGDGVKIACIRLR